MLNNKITNGVYPQAHYHLIIEELITPISIFSIESHERLDQMWQYRVTFTSHDHSLTVDKMLMKLGQLILHPQQDLSDLYTLGSSFIDHQPRTLHGIITEFSVISVNQDESHYAITLKPRIALLDKHHQYAIYQNQSVIDVVDEVLRRHGFTGIDFRFELQESYPLREFIVQWQESDLHFIKRILADVGIWFRFETNAKHHCEVIVFSDYEQGIIEGGAIAHKAPSGMRDATTHSVWDLQLLSKVVEATTRIKEYDYRHAQADLTATANSKDNKDIRHGTDYRYSENRRHLSAGSVESVSWFAAIRQQQKAIQQIVISGKTNQYSLEPGQRITISGHPLNYPLTDGLLITEVVGTGNRTDAYAVNFTAVPYNPLKPYRPNPLTWPHIAGTIPAVVTSPDNDTYGYIDTQGRYRVKFNFDLKTWQSGRESLWLRLARPYAGDTYGFHFPLIDGTEVAIAFHKGNPDAPYIAHAMHNSQQPDLVSTANKHRNVIHTPANNKLRMDDKRGQEHIKLATEYGKTQLNIGHLVDSNKQSRGEGFELRTDEWGAIAAAGGLYLTTSTQPKAQREQLEMHSAITQLENALSIAKALQNSVLNAQAHPADIDSQAQLKADLKQLERSGILAYAQDGLGLTSPENIQLSSMSSVTVTAENQADISVLKKITLAAGEALSLFAHKAGIKLFAAKGKVEIEAQHDAMALAAKQDLNIESVDGSVLISAAKELTLLCGGSYIKIANSGIELGSDRNVTFKCNAMQKMGPSTKDKASAIRGYVEPQPGDTFKFDIMLTDMPGEGGFPLAHVAWKILDLPKGPQDKNVGYEPERDILYQGETDENGQVNLTDEQQKQLADIYRRRGNVLWLYYPGQYRQLNVCMIDRLNDDDIKQKIALDAMGYYQQNSNINASKTVSILIENRFKNMAAEPNSALDTLKKQRD